MLLNRVRAELSPMAADDERNSGVAAVEWCMRHGLVQQAYTLARELIVTLVCIRFGVSHTSRGGRETAERQISAAARARRKNYDTQTVETDARRQDAGQGDSLSMDILGFLAEKEELLKLWDTISGMRNDVNHAGWLEDAANRQALTKRMDVLALRRLLAEAFGNAESPVGR